MEDTKNNIGSYWYKEFYKKEKQIDTFCVRHAERLNDVRYKLSKKWDTLSQDSSLTRLLQEKESLENNLRHFHGTLDEEYIRGHNLGPVYWEE